MNNEKTKTVDNTDQNQRLLYEAEGDCDFDRLKELIDAGADVNAKDYDGTTSLMWAVLSGEMDVVEMFLKHGSDINARNDIGESALHLVAITGFIEIAKVLIENGADINAMDEFGISPIREARLNEDVEMVLLFRRYSAEE